MQPMKATARLSSEERRAAIIQAVRRAFAEKGFHGTTTRELAKAAGVSEALLFKHFPNKEALFSAMQLSCCSGPDQDRVERLKALEPSASTMVLMVHFLVSKVVGHAASPSDEQQDHNRLMVRSLAEDGEFARLLFRRLTINWIPKIEECLKAAVAAGEAVNGRVVPRLAGWFTHHLAEVLMLHLLPATAVVDYGMPRDKLVEQAVWFALRGIGLKDEAIQRYYNPKALALLEG
jgi:AcrR family transcriptional regulator